MNDTIVVDTSRLRGPRGVKSRPKGRQVDAQALADVRALLGDAPRERSLLIEFLHRIQDARGHLPAAHLVAPASTTSKW
jgi:formate dehydrogenase beta subunit